MAILRTEVTVHGKAPRIKVRPTDSELAPALPNDPVREKLVEEFAEALYKQRTGLILYRQKLTKLQLEALEEEASQGLATIERMGWLRYPRNRHFDVVIDDPDMTKAYEYRVEAPTAHSALYAAARQAIFEDPTGGMPGNKTKDGLFHESPALIDAVSMYGTVKEAPPRSK